MVALFTWRVDSSSSGHFIFTVEVAPVQPSMSESGKSSKVFKGAPWKLLIVKVSFVELSETFFTPVIERMICYQVLPVV